MKGSGNIIIRNTLRIIHLDLVDNKTYAKLENLSDDMQMSSLDSKLSLTISLNHMWILW